MRPFTRLFLIAALLLVPAPGLLAQTAVDPSGHWEGTIKAPTMDVKIDVDLAKNSRGKLTGTFGGQQLHGLPLARVAVEGASIRFQIGNAAGERLFEGILSGDGTTMSGQYSRSGGSVPFSLTRAGEPRIEAAAKSPSIGKTFEGTWEGTLAVEGKELRAVLTLTNHPDDTATGVMVSLDEGRLEIPVSTIAQAGSSLTLELKAVGASFVGVLNKEGTELAGTYRHPALAVPLTFRRAAAASKK